ncbi:thiol reductant ABC exporter subunit CydC [uncultured Thermanaerothrix sp.]|uniref:thiol reductant ABC exporter subunit CydC n=1 Tax=uncultured Thermanaerothrix sp. TaxID=1195149 RepID=UPI00263440F3|nr:thiol reductant ABC exporter subunit CydC [uncultured Thermanaerothrix sp.]
MKLIWRLVQFLRPYLAHVITSILLGIATIASSIGLLGTAAYLIARAALHPSIAELHIAIVGVRFLGLARSVIRYVERWVSHGVNLRLLGQLQRWLYRTLAPLLPARQPYLPTGDLLNRAMTDLENLENFYVRFISPALVMVFTTLGLAWFSGVFYPRIWLWVAAGLLGAGGVVPLMSYHMQQRLALQQVKASANLNTRLVEFIQGMEDYLLFGQEKFMFKQIEDLEVTHHHIQMRRALRGGLANGLASLWVWLTAWGVLWAGLDPVARGEFSGVLLAVLVIVVLASYEAVSAVVQGAQNLPLALHSAQRLLSLETLKSSQTASTHVHFEETTQRPDIQMRDLSFRYAADAPLVLKGINLEIPFGRRVGIVGPSGAGKSTLVNLLLRFWDYDEGEILIGGVPLRLWDERVLHQVLAVLEQKPYIFSDTLRGNLRIAAPRATEDQLWWALEQVELADWARQLPEGLNTWVGNLGAQMSGGERQRLALARLFLSKASVIVLDEPGAHLERAQEARILGRLMTWVAERTLIWITHSPQSLDYVDELVVLRQGQIVECGTPHTLRGGNGFFAQMVKLSSRFADDVAAQ